MSDTTGPLTLGTNWPPGVAPSATMVADAVLGQIALMEQRAVDPQTAWSFHWPECAYLQAEEYACSCGAMGWLLAKVSADLKVVREHYPVDPCIGTFGPEGAACPTLRAMLIQETT